MISVRNGISIPGAYQVVQFSSRNLGKPNRGFQRFPVWHFCETHRVKKVNAVALNLVPARPIAQNQNLNYHKFYRRGCSKTRVVRTCGPMKQPPKSKDAVPNTEVVEQPQVVKLF
jgi:hypothetical protein